MAFKTQNQNQFVPAVMIGAPDFQAVVNSVSAKILSTSTAVLQNGSVVKLVAGAASEILVDAQASSTDANAWGVISYSVRKNAYSPNDTVEVLLRDSIVWMLAGGAIERGDKVSATAATTSADPTVVADTTASHYILGIALDKAASGGYVRVQITPSQNPAA
jgi:hypothetical protein